MKLNDSHRPVQLQDFWKCLPARPPPTLQRRGKGVVDITALYGHCPLLILSYTDYVALSDAVAWVISSQPEAVMVFAPTFLHGNVLLSSMLYMSVLLTTVYTI